MSETSQQGTGDGTQGDGTEDVREPQEVDTEAQAKQREQILQDGRFAVTEGDDNPIAKSDNDFIGVAEEYQEYVDTRFAPLPAQGGPEADLEKRAQENQRLLDSQATTGNNRTGYSPDKPHPSDARQPSADLINKQRQALDRQAGSR